MGLAAAVPLSVTLAIPGTGRQPIGIKDLLLPLIAVAAVLVGLAGPGRLLPAGPTATRRALSLLALAGAAAWLAAHPAQDLAHGNAPVYEPQTAALVSATIDALYGQPPELPAGHESTGMPRRRSSPCGSATSRSPRRRSTCTPA